MSITASESRVLVTTYKYLPTITEPLTPSSDVPGVGPLSSVIYTGDVELDISYTCIASRYELDANI